MEAWNLSYLHVCVFDDDANLLYLIILGVLLLYAVVQSIIQLHFHSQKIDGYQLL